MILNIILGITIWMVIGNIWVDLLNSLTVKLGNASFTVIERIIQSLIWPYSISLFMRFLESEVKNIGDNPAINNTLGNEEWLNNKIDEYVVKILDTDLSTYKKVIKTKCTVEEIKDIKDTICESEDDKEIERVKQIFNSKLDNN